MAVCLNTKAKMRGSYTYNSYFVQLCVDIQVCLAAFQKYLEFFPLYVFARGHNTHLGINK